MNGGGVWPFSPIRSKRLVTLATSLTWAVTKRMSDWSSPVSSSHIYRPWNFGEDETSTFWDKIGQTDGRIAALLNEREQDQRVTIKQNSKFKDSTRRSLQSADVPTCVVPRTLSSYGDRTFATAVSRLRNSLPVQLSCVFVDAWARRCVTSDMWRLTYVLRITVSVGYRALHNSSLSTRDKKWLR